MFGAEAIDPQSLLSPSVLFNAAGWLSMGAAILFSLQKGWIITKSSHEREMGVKDKAYKDMETIKDKVYSDMLVVKNEQLQDHKKQIDDWKAAAGSSDSRADLLAENQRDLMTGMQLVTSFVEGIYHRSGGGAG